MWKVVSLLLLVLCICAPAALAQLPDATVGVPYTLDLLPGISGLETALAQDGAEVAITITISSGSLPPGLTLSADGVISGTPTAAGPYNFTLNFEVIITDETGQTIEDVNAPEPLGIQVDGFTGAALAVDPTGVSFSLHHGDTSTVSKAVLITNRAEQPQTFTATASSSTPGWLTVSPASGAVPFGASRVTISVDPTRLMAGTYSGSVAISFAPSGDTINIPVVATVNENTAQIELSQTGLRMRTVSGGGAPPSAIVDVLNGGTGSFSFNATASTISGGSWLSVAPASGSASSSPSPLTISVDSSKLQAGDYYGQVQVSAKGVSNSPQIVHVVLNVAPAGTDLGAFLQPTGLIFVAQAGGANPAPQSVSITTPSSTPLSFNTALTFQPGSYWFSVQPPTGNVSATAPVQLQVQPNVTGLTAGVYTGLVTLYFSDNTVGNVAILFIVTPGSGPSGQSTARWTPHAASCTPTELLPVFTLLGSGFATVASWPTPLAVSIVDDCGNFMTSGSVIASFSSGDPAISLLSLGNGTWTATWQPHAPAAQATITVLAQEDNPELQGTASVGGSLETNPSTPVISAGGAVSAASYVANQPLAPGSFLSIFGSNLSAGQNQSKILPLATQLGATQVILAGEQLPLQFAVDGQVNAIVPYDVPINATMQLVVMNGPAISMPEPVVIAPAQPAVFTQNLSGQGAGIVVAAPPSGKQFEVNLQHPITAGDVAIIYCAGLGAVNPPVPAGSAAPMSPLSHTVSPVTVTIGGVNAKVQFAGLAPGYAGLYQVNALVPKGITPGNNVPLVVTTAGQQSSPVTVALK